MSDSPRRKLIEVALPLEAINKACKADKNIKTGTVRNIHKWFAPMPPPAWRALLFATLVNDPGDEAERRRLHDIIEGLCPVSGGPSLEAVRRARAAIRDADLGENVRVFDPFCGGGSTLLEAQRLGLVASGSDLNPVPVLISRFLTRVLPEVSGHASLHGQDAIDGGDGLTGFKSDVLHYANVVGDSVKNELAPYYPSGPNGDPVIAWRWARTVPSPDPQYGGAPTPIVGDWWLSKKKGSECWISPVVDRKAGEIRFEIATHGTPPDPAKRRCLLSGSALTFDYIRNEGKQGRLGLTMLAAITDGDSGRAHFSPDGDQVDAARRVPEVDLPRADLPARALGFRVQEYGLTTWWDLFTPRQLFALDSFSRGIAAITEHVEADGGDAPYAAAITESLTLALGKLAGFMSSQSLWRHRTGAVSKAESAFGRAALPMTFDFAEVNPFGGSVGDWMQVVKTSVRAFDAAVTDGVPAVVEQMDARAATADLEDGATTLVATDPPYFDQIGYAALSDYFYVWHRRALRHLDPKLFATIETPKTGELVAEPARHHGDADEARDSFVSGLSEVLGNIANRDSDLPTLIVYASRQQEAGEDGVVSTGWDAMLEAVLGAGLGVVGTWPVHGTGTTRQRAQASNALATYVVMVCRPRDDSAGITNRKDFRAELRRRLSPAVADLQASAIAPVDLAQAAIGPGMAVYSTFSKVLEADGSPMRVRTALGLINEVLDELLAEQEADFDSDTRWCTAWFEEHGMAAGEYGVAEALSRAKNTSVEGLAEAGVLSSAAGKVRLIGRQELDGTWDPSRDSRLTVWEVTHHLIQALDVGGEEAAANVLREVGGLGEPALELAYRLFSICDRKKWATEALGYNSLAASWPEIIRLAASDSDAAGPEQESLI